MLLNKIILCATVLVLVSAQQQQSAGRNRRTIGNILTNVGDIFGYDVFRRPRIVIAIPAAVPAGPPPPPAPAPGPPGPAPGPGPKPGPAPAAGPPAAPATLTDSVRRQFSINLNWDRNQSPPQQQVIPALVLSPHTAPPPAAAPVAPLPARSRVLDYDEQSERNSDDEDDERPKRFHIEFPDYTNLELSETRKVDGKDERQENKEKFKREFDNFWEKSPWTVQHGYKYIAPQESRTSQKGNEANQLPRELSKYQEADLPKEKVKSLKITHKIRLHQKPRDDNIYAPSTAVTYYQLPPGYIQGGQNGETAAPSYLTSKVVNAELLKYFDKKKQADLAAQGGQNDDTADHSYLTSKVVNAELLKYFDKKFQDDLANKQQVANANSENNNGLPYIPYDVEAEPILTYTPENGETESNLPYIPHNDETESSLPYTPQNVETVSSLPHTPQNNEKESRLPYISDDGETEASPLSNPEKGNIESNLSYIPDDADIIIVPYTQDNGAIRQDPYIPENGEVHTNLPYIQETHSHIPYSEDYSEAISRFPFIQDNTEKEPSPQTQDYAANPLDYYASPNPDATNLPLNQPSDHSKENVDENHAPNESEEENDSQRQNEEEDVESHDHPRPNLKDNNDEEQKEEEESNEDRQPTIVENNASENFEVENLEDAAQENEEEESKAEEEKSGEETKNGDEDGPASEHYEDERDANYIANIDSFIETHFGAPEDPEYNKFKESVRSQEFNNHEDATENEETEDVDSENKKFKDEQNEHSEQSENDEDATENEENKEASDARDAEDKQKIGQLEKQHEKEFYNIFPNLGEGSNDKNFYTGFNQPNNNNHEASGQSIEKSPPPSQSAKANSDDSEKKIENLFTLNHQDSKKINENSFFDRPTSKLKDNNDKLQKPDTKTSDDHVNKFDIDSPYKAAKENFLQSLTPEKVEKYQSSSKNLIKYSTSPHPKETFRNKENHESTERSVVQPLYSGIWHHLGGLQELYKADKPVTVPFDIEYSGSEKNTVKNNSRAKRDTRTRSEISLDDSSEEIKEYEKDNEYYPESYSEKFTYEVPEPDLPHYTAEEQQDPSTENVKYSDDSPETTNEYDKEHVQDSPLTRYAEDFTFEVPEPKVEQHNREKTDSNVDSIEHFEDNPEEVNEFDKEQVQYSPLTRYTGDFTSEESEPKVAQYENRERSDNKLIEHVEDSPEETKEFDEEHVQYSPLTKYTEDFTSEVPEPKVARYENRERRDNKVESTEHFEDSPKEIKEFDKKYTQYTPLDRYTEDFTYEVPEPNVPQERKKRDTNAESEQDDTPDVIKEYNNEHFKYTPLGRYTEDFTYEVPEPKLPDHESRRRRETDAQSEDFDTPEEEFNKSYTQYTEDFTYEVPEPKLPDHESRRRRDTDAQSEDFDTPEEEFNKAFTQYNEGFTYEVPEPNMPHENREKRDTYAENEDFLYESPEEVKENSDESEEHLDDSPEEIKDYDRGYSSYVPERYSVKFNYEVPEPAHPDYEKLESKDYKEEKELSPFARITSNQSGHKSTVIRIDPPVTIIT